VPDTPQIDTNLPTEAVTLDEVTALINVLDETSFKLKDAPYFLGIRSKLQRLHDLGATQSSVQSDDA
jgi:hypothetical protein